MTNDRNTSRRWWIVAATAVLAGAVVMEELLRSGTLADGLLDHWWGQAGSAALMVAAVATGLYFVHRAYRS